MDNKIYTDPLLERANAVLADGDVKYAMFLYREALKKAPECLEIREALHKVRSSMHVNSRSLFSIFKLLYIHAKIFYQKHRRSSASAMLDSIESLLDINPNDFNAYRMLASAAEEAKMYPLAEFSINEIPEDERTQDDFLIVARSLLEQKKFDKSLKIANLVLEKSPDNAEAKDIVWKSSVDKQINQNVDLVVADGIKQVAPPKVDASQIIMSNPKSEDENGKATENAKKKK